MTIEHTHAFLSALAGIDTVYDFRAYHDQRRDLPSRVWRGTFAACERAMQAAQADGFGIHVVMNETDGIGLKRANIRTCRAQLLDLDGVDAAQRMAQVLAGPVAPHMIVRTSPGKAQLWFKVTPHDDLGLHEDNQVRLLRAYGGDDQVVGAERTARLPGFYHLKAEPSLVTVEAGPLWGSAGHSALGIAHALQHVSVERAAHADRQALGHGPWQAPNREMLERALDRIDPNSLTWQEWIAVTAATKQAGWSLGPDVARSIWDGWCARYVGNDAGENGKQWRAIGDATSSGWAKLERESGLVSERMFAAVPAVVDGSVGSVPLSAAEIPVQPTGGLYMTAAEQAVYFKDCFYVTELDRIIGPNGRMMNQSRFNSKYGGYHFLIDQIGKDKTRYAWNAVTLGEVFRVPKVDHIRFRPELPFGKAIEDSFGEIGVNTYRAPKQMAVAGDVSLWLDHMERLIPDERDRQIVYSWLAQCVQRPGVKIGWALVIQSMEGAGKTVFERILEAAVGRSYIHKPAAKELTEGGGKFNSWLHRKLVIIINEVKTDEKRDLVEVMKPWITDDPVEIQYKGQDQIVSDNPSNFCMFTNYKDAIPVSDTSRRYAIIYSALQTQEDMDRLGMDGDYFSRLYGWIKKGGDANIVDWLQRFVIPDEFDAQTKATRAPRTTSTAEAVEISRGWLEQSISEAVEQGRQGFRGDWVAAAMVGKLVQEQGMRSVSKRAVASAIQSLGYTKVGQATKVYMQEGITYQSVLYNKRADANIREYGAAQGYEGWPVAAE